MVLDNDCLVAGVELEFGRGSFTTCSGLSEKIELENKHEPWRRSDSDPLE